LKLHDKNLKKEIILSITYYFIHSRLFYL